MTYYFTKLIDPIIALDRKYHLNQWVMVYSNLEDEFNNVDLKMDGEAEPLGRVKQLIERLTGSSQYEIMVIEV